MLTFQLEPQLSIEDFYNVLKASGLSDRRPVDDRSRLGEMLKNADIIFTARMNKVIVGVSRAITDYSYCCYLSDLAVDKQYQQQGIGKKLIVETHKAAGTETSLILLSSPAAQSYYPKIGMNAVPNGWIIPRKN
jgi:predicted N-acetyltransferase YhbS